MNKDKEYKELLYVALMMLSSKDRHIIPELLYIMDSDTFIRLINIYSGRSIKVPSKPEIIKAINTIVYYYHVEVNGEDPEVICKRLKITGHHQRHIRRRVSLFKSRLKNDNLNIPGYMRSSKLMKGIYDDLWKPKKLKKKVRKKARKKKEH